MLNDALERALERLNEMERSVASQAVGKDLRSVRDLLKKHQVSHLIFYFIITYLYSTFLVFGR